MSGFFSLKLKASSLALFLAEDKTEALTPLVISPLASAAALAKSSDSSLNFSLFVDKSLNNSYNCFPSTLFGSRFGNVLPSILSLIPSRAPPKVLLNSILPESIISDKLVRFSSYQRPLSPLAIKSPYLCCTSNSTSSLCLGDKEFKTSSITSIPFSVTFPLLSLKRSNKNL